MNKHKPSFHRPILIFTTGPLLAVFGFLTGQRALQATDQNEALLYTLLATFFGTVFLGWLIYVGILLYFSLKDRSP